MNVSVIVSNFNGARFLPRLLASLRAQTHRDLELVVVDRCSTDGSGAFLAAQPDVRVLSEPAETGLVAGYHRGAQAAGGDAFFFVNEDMWFEPGCVERLVAALDLEARIGAADGWHWRYDGPEWLHGSVGFVPARWAINSPHPRWSADFQVPSDGVTGIPFACAGAALVHRRLYEELGGWDTSFFLDHEDVDFFLRAWQRGWRVVNVPGARLHHAVNASNGQVLGAAGVTVSQRRYLAQRCNMAVIALKTFSWPALGLALLQWPVVVANNLLNGRWRLLAGDLRFPAELLRRFPEAWAFRRANAPYNHRSPGERFFADPRFRAPATRPPASADELN